MGVFLNAAPSRWLQRWLHLLPAQATVLDVACGSGRHVRWLAQQGHRVTGIDRDAAALQPLAALGEVQVADIETGPWPLPGRRFALVLVTNYLWRPLFARLAESVGEGGLLVYETFADGQQTIGRPARPEFLLQPGELLAAFPGLRVLAYEDGFDPVEGRYVQRIAAVRGLPPPARPWLTGEPGTGG